MAEFTEVLTNWGRMCREMNREGNALSCSRCRLNKSICDKMIREYDKQIAKEAEEDIMAWSEKNPEYKNPTWIEYLVEKGFLTKQTQEVVMLEGDRIEVVTGYFDTEKASEEIPDSVIGILEKLYGESFE